MSRSIAPTTARVNAARTVAFSCPSRLDSIAADPMAALLTPDDQYEEW
jgi:hypothetical protein